MSGSNHPAGPPYAPPTAALGGTPNVHADIPITAVFMAIYFTIAVANIRIVIGNKKRHHKFLIQLFLIPYCMSRVVAGALRIAWACVPHNVNLSIAAQIFINAGVVVLYLFNVLLTQRILRAMHPKIGWHPLVRWTYRALYILLVSSLIMLITSTIINFFTLNPHTHQITLWILRGTSLYFVIFTFSPLPTLALSFLLPLSERAEHFGKGSTMGRVLTVSAATCFCTIIAGFRMGTTWMPPRMKTDPAWYDSTAAFYCFGFMMEIFTLLVYYFGEIHERFHVPNGSSKRATYLVEEVARNDSESSDRPQTQESDLEKASIKRSSSE